MADNGTLSEWPEKAEELKEQLRRRRLEANDAQLRKVAAKLEDEQIHMKARRTLKGHQAKVLHVAWASDKRHIVSSAQDGNVFIWDAFTSKKEVEIETPSTCVTACDVSPSLEIMACGGLDNKCIAYPNIMTDPNPKKRTVAMHTKFVSACAFVGLDHEILTASGDTKCMLCDVETCEPIHNFYGHTSDVLCLAVCPNEVGRVFASAGCDWTIRLWDTRSGLCSHILDGHTADINDIRFMPTGDAVVTASDDGTCRVFDLRANQELISLKKESVVFPPCSADVSLSGRLLFAGYMDHTIRVWDVLKGQNLAVLMGHDSCVTCVRVSPDGTALCSSSWDGLIKVWA
ncbi:guanine nucleotide-binding protein subunit beta-5-like [Oscarella lobularis]|uniref:guanine nucleotide-binding protein subunit beta-5-like n=1 Tax=Oscarella lobularis TaxID=121494 RepID=UPI0033142991